MCMREYQLVGCQLVGCIRALGLVCALRSGLLEANNIYGNKKYGVQSKTGGHPTVRMNRIHDKVYGIYLTESGGGIYEENRIHNIRGTGICARAANANIAPVCGAQLPH